MQIAPTSILRPADDFQLTVESQRNRFLCMASLFRLPLSADRVKFGYTYATIFNCVTNVRIVLDTSVLVAAARSRNGASYQVVSMLPTPRFDFALTIALYTEWQAVLTRPEHMPPGVTVDAALAYLRYLASLAHLQDVHFLWRPFLHDPDDDMVLECAVASGSQYIVTHNVKDFRRVPELKVQAITPADFLTLLRS